MAVNTTIGNYRIGSDGIARLIDTMNAKADGYSSNTNYLVMIDTSSHRIGVYRGSIRNWSRIDYSYCADGNSSAPTPRGTFTITSKEGSENAGSYTYWYISNFGGSAICSVPCYKGTKEVANSTVGKAVSTNGMVRVSMDTAEWIRDTVPNGTKVVVY